MMYRCQCCGFEREITSDEEFNQLDWEKIPGEEGQILCNLCPAYYISEDSVCDHSAVHTSWSTWGRPEEFSIADCLVQADKKLVPNVDALGEQLFKGNLISEKQLTSKVLASLHHNEKKSRQKLDEWVRYPLVPSGW